ncbi:MAG: hypothetical protein KAR06_04010 [Deltaproteobacteria bacterium]|nr:hypothetical protein [Deltaproteobacteria bacterium]
MTTGREVCPSCGRVVGGRFKTVLTSTVIGALVGLGVGVGFVTIYFGTAPGYLHFMALIHEGAGTGIGAVLGLVIGALRT